MFSWCQGNGNNNNNNNNALVIEGNENDSGKSTEQKTLDALASLVDALASIKTTLDGIRKDFASIQKTQEAYQKRLDDMSKENERVGKNSEKVTGTYFATHKEIWGKQRVKVDTEDGKGGEELKQIQDSIKDWSPTFLKHCQMPTMEDKNLPEKIHTPQPAWRASEAKKIFFDSHQASFSNIFLTPASGKPSDSSPTHRSLAHSAPASPNCSVFWTYFIELLTGENTVKMTNDDSKLKRFYTVHGLWDFEMDGLGDFHEYKYQGLKNLPQNLLALPPGHERYYDGMKGGNLIIVPIVDLKASRDPNEKYDIKSQYDLLVIGRTQAVYNWIYNGEIPQSASPYSLKLDESVEDATTEEINIATAFLKTYAIAAAHLALQNLKTDLDSAQEDNALWVSKVAGRIVSHKKQPLKDSQESAKSSVSLKTEKTSKESKNDLLADNIQKARDALKSVEEYGVWVPTLQKSFNIENHKVMKVKLSTYFQTCGLENELYPAWSLLGFKALANFLVYADQPFIAGSKTWEPPRMDLPRAVPVASVEINTTSVNDLEGDLSDDEASVWNEYNNGDERDGQSKEHKLMPVFSSSSTYTNQFNYTCAL